MSDDNDDALYEIDRTLVSILGVLEEIQEAIPEPDDWIAMQVLAVLVAAQHGATNRELVTMAFEYADAFLEEKQRRETARGVS